MIVIPERQIESVSVTLKQNVSAAVKNTSGSIGNIYTQSGNKCEVTISDLYMDGLSWITLEDIASSRAGGASYLKNNALLPKCEKGQDPETTPCYALYNELDESSITGTSGDSVGFSRPWIIISLFYDIKDVGTTEFQTFFRVTKTTLQHGGMVPKVTIQGESAISVQFNQQFNSIFLEKDKSIIEELNEKVFKKQGYELQNVCGSSADERKLEKSYKINGLTPIQILKKHIGEGNVGEVYISEKAENAKTIQICERADYSCLSSRLFFLGKGLYEQYNISGAFAINPAELNSSRSSGQMSDGNVLPGEESIKPGNYRVSLKYPETKAKQIEEIEKADSGAFTNGEKQFQANDDYYTTTSADGWRGEAAGSKFNITKLVKQYPYEKAKNAKASLGGIVTRVSEDSGEVVIQSKFSIQLDSANNSSASKEYLVIQEFRNLKSVSVKEDTSKVLKYGETVGAIESDPNKETVTRFYIVPGQSNTATITIPRASVKQLISPTQRLSDKDKEGEAPTDGTSGKDVVGWVGSTGESSGPHVHAEIRASGGGSASTQTVVAADFDPYITIGGRKPSEWTTSSGHKNVPGGRAGHNGVDIAGANIEGQPIRIVNGTFTGRGSDSGYGNYVSIDIGGGKEVFLGHLLNATEGVIARERYIDTPGTRVSGTGLGGSPILDEKTSLSIKTKFKGVPKALFLEPGKTVLSFISDYDNWIKADKNESEVDPGVWIPEKYKNWIVNETTWKWEKGDLRMEINALRPYHYGLAWEGLIPNFDKYRESFPYKDYYDYIRSPSDLCYTNTNGENSCSKCGKASDFGVSGGAGPDGVSTAYAQGPCQYTGSKYQAKNGTINSLLNAAQTGLGINNKYGLAGILGNSGWESAGFNPTAVGPSGEVGLFQWNPAAGRLQSLQKFSTDNGLDYQTVDAQVQFFVYEVKNQGYSSVIPAMNGATSVEDGVAKFESIYEKAGVPALEGRNEIANEIYNNLTCS